MDNKNKIKETLKATGTTVLPFVTWAVLECPECRGLRAILQIGSRRPCATCKGRGAVKHDVDKLVEVEAEKWAAPDTSANPG